MWTARKKKRKNITWFPYKIVCVFSELNPKQISTAENVWRCSENTQTILYGDCGMFLQLCLRAVHAEAEFVEDWRLPAGFSWLSRNVRDVHITFYTVFYTVKCFASLLSFKLVTQEVFKTARRAPKAPSKFVRSLRCVLSCFCRRIYLFDTFGGFVTLAWPFRWFVELSSRKHREKTVWKPWAALASDSPVVNGPASSKVWRTGLTQP